MTKQTRKFLADLRKAYRNGSDQTQSEIWNILTALRGPDTSSVGEKDCTTAVIRKAVFGSIRVLGDMENDNQNHVDFRKANKFTSSHFKMHMQWAFNALGLKWGSKNDTSRAK